MPRYYIIILLLIINAQFAHAQQDTSAVQSKKPWMLTLGTDLKLRSIQGSYNYYYEGEYLKNNSEVNWGVRKQKLDDLLEFGSLFDLKSDVLISRNKSTKVGLSYNFGILLYDADTSFVDEFGNRQNYIYQRNFYFIAITGLAEQSWYFRKRESEIGDPFVYGSLAAGFYRGGEEIAGPGMEYFSEARLGLGYHFKNNWMLRVWGAQNLLYYRERQISPIFDREQKVNKNMNLTYAGIGFCKQFTLIPD